MLRVVNSLSAGDTVVVAAEIIERFCPGIGRMRCPSMSKPSRDTKCTNIRIGKIVVSAVDDSSEALVQAQLSSAVGNHVAGDAIGIGLKKELAARGSKVISFKNKSTHRLLQAKSPAMDNGSLQIRIDSPNLGPRSNQPAVGINFVRQPRWRSKALSTRGTGPIGELSCSRTAEEVQRWIGIY